MRGKALENDLGVPGDLSMVAGRISRVSILSSSRKGQRPLLFFPIHHSGLVIHPCSLQVRLGTEQSSLQEVSAGVKTGWHVNKLVGRTVGEV